MVGKRKKQPVLFDVGNVFDLELDPSSFYAQLALAGPDLFPDDAFADLYSPTVGRPSVPPGQMALLMLLQYHESLSDQAAVDHSAYDLRWAAVLRRSAGRPLCARTTLVLFRARLALHDAAERIFDRAIQHAREKGLLKERALQVILDTKPVVGRGAVEDTYNLLARAMDRLLRQLAAAAGLSPADWAAAHELSRYVRRREESLKGQAEIDWSDAAARRKFLTEEVADARRLLVEAEMVLCTLSEETRAALREDIELLRSILAQDVVETPGSGGGKPQAELREGTAKERVPSVTDPEQRHGRKSESRTFTGHKARVAVDAESQLIVGVEVLPGNAGDAQGALEQVAAVEERTGMPVSETIGDCAFGAGATRAEFAAADRELRARTPAAGRGWQLPKSRFTLIFTRREVTEVRCPNGKSTSEWKPRAGGGRVFTFGKCCRRCPLRHACVTRPGQSRSIQIHPQEWLLEEARKYQASEEGKRTLGRRVVAEHALGRLSRLGIGQARYFGRSKTRIQLLLAATVVNLRWTWNWAAGEDTGPVANAPDTLFRAGRSPWSEGWALIRTLIPQRWSTAPAGHCTRTAALPLPWRRDRVRTVHFCHRL